MPATTIPIGHRRRHHRATLPTMPTKAVSPGARPAQCGESMDVAYATSRLRTTSPRSTSRPTARRAVSRVESDGATAPRLGRRLRPGTPTIVDGGSSRHRPSSGVRRGGRPRPADPAASDDLGMINVQHLTKRYGDHQAVDDVSFRCEPGTVTGFLGPNGAGKSTTLRMITGLTPPTSGTASVSGTDYRRLANPGRHVGVLLDASAQHSGRNGREVLTLSAKVLGVPDTRVGEMLELVGLNQTAAKRRVGNYSLGMRQRLGLANALLGDPTVLIL